LIKKQGAVSTSELLKSGLCKFDLTLYLRKTKLFKGIKSTRAFGRKIYYRYEKQLEKYLQKKFNKSLNPSIHRNRRRIKSIIRRIKESKISKKNKRLLLDFRKYCDVEEDLSLARQDRLLVNLFGIVKKGWLKKDFDKAKKKDIVKLVETIKKQGYAPLTIKSFQDIIRKFYKWLRKSEDLPEEVSWIHSHVGKNDYKTPEELLTKEEIYRMIDVADTLRDKTLIAALYESGCRISEFASLKIKNAEFDEHGAILIVDGKTGRRRVRLVEAAPLLKGWLKEHPYRSNPITSLWLISCYEGFANLIKRVSKKAKINKRVYPHLFRHSRATELASKLTEAVLKEHFGWCPTSRVPACYIHLSGRDVDKAILNLYRLEEKQDLKTALRVVQNYLKRKEVRG